MGDKLRRLLSQLLATATHAALPALCLDAVLLVIVSRRGGTHAAGFYLGMLLLFFVLCLAAAAAIEYQAFLRAFSRIDAELIGDAFSGFAKKDRLFCRGMRECADGDPGTALEHFLQAADFDLTPAETGVCAFYIGRCYQLTDAPANAAYHFQRARENGFSAPHAMLFEARSCVSAGDFDRAYTLYMALLEKLGDEIPPDFQYIYTDLGFLYLRQNDPRHAAEWLRKSIDANMNYAFALSGMAVAALQSGRTEQALEFRARAVMSHVSDPEGFRRYFRDVWHETALLHPEWNFPELPPDLPPETAETSSTPEGE